MPLFFSKTTPLGSLKHSWTTIRSFYSACTFSQATPLPDTLVLSKHNRNSSRSFSSFNVYLTHKTPIAPASEKTVYLNRFDHADHPDLWKLDEENHVPHSKATNHEELVETTNHPHHFKGFLLHRRYGHYNTTCEPTFPTAPNLEAGELASGANVVRTTVWQNENEPAIVSIGKFTPYHFRPAGYAENAPNPDSINSEAHPDFREYRLPHGHSDRRPFLYFVSAVNVFVVASVARSIICKTVHLFWPAKDVLTGGVTEVDLSPIQPGQQITVKWRDKPVFVRHRSPDEIAFAKSDDALFSSLKDPQLDADRTTTPEWLITIGICTHLGCIPITGGDYHGYFCPCHGSHYDASGRIRQGPAPSNLEVPPYTFLTPNMLRLG